MPACQDVERRCYADVMIDGAASGVYGKHTHKLFETNCNVSTTAFGGATNILL
jgi:hypothetical protein